MGDGWGPAVQQVQEVARSSSDSTSMRRPFWAKWNQYSSMLPKLAISRSAMSRAPSGLWSSFSGSIVPSAEQPVRSTSMAWALAGICSSTPRSAAGRRRRATSLRL
jgi:hypothetical protein